MHLYKPYQLQIEIDTPQLETGVVPQLEIQIEIHIQYILFTYNLLKFTRNHQSQGQAPKQQSQVRIQI